ncbi:hypothetical protein, partial [Chimaeribacter californicus]
ADRQGEIMIKLVRDNDTDSALEAWNTLVDAIETKQYPVVAKGQMSTIPRTFFVGEQKPENQPQEVPQDEENAVPA